MLHIEHGHHQVHDSETSKTTVEGRALRRQREARDLSPRHGSGHDFVTALAVLEIVLEILWRIENLHGL
jgi:hypothetical protein